jgi:hypothetical protein
MFVHITQILFGYFNATAKAWFDTLSTQIGCQSLVAPSKSLHVRQVVLLLHGAIEVWFAGSRSTTCVASLAMHGKELNVF